MNFLQRMLIPCQRTTALIEKKSVQMLSGREAVQLFLHTRMCSACRLYAIQSALLDKTLRKALKSDKVGLNVNAPINRPEAKIEILNAIKEKLTD